jgi:hypothetical protein
MLSATEHVAVGGSIGLSAFWSFGLTSMEFWMTRDTNSRAAMPLGGPADEKCEPVFGQSSPLTCILFACIVFKPCAKRNSPFDVIGHPSSSLAGAVPARVPHSTC